MRFNHYCLGGAAALAMMATGAIAQLASFGGAGIKFPSDPGTMYMSIDRADNMQFREYYANATALEAAKKGEPLPAGSVLTGVLYKAKLNAQGEPDKGADGRFIKDDLIGYIVMEKQKGWGESLPADLRNGEWEYQSFTAAKAANEKANLKACYECHRDKVGASKDYVFTLDKLSGR